MPIQDHLSSALGRRDQGPNRELAAAIVAGNESIDDLILFIKSSPNKALLQDAVLTLAWVAEQSHELVAPHAALALANLQSSINRVVFGSMIALSHICDLIADELYGHLPTILHVMEQGTPVTRDHGFKILVTLYQQSSYSEDIHFIILEQISLAPPNQIGQYAERYMSVMSAGHRDDLIGLLEGRKRDLSNPHHLKRLNRNLKKLRARMNR